MEEGNSNPTVEAAKAAEAGVGAIGALIKAAGSDPNAKAAGGELGKSALTVTKTINVALLPLAVINFSYEKAREYFENRFRKDLEDKTTRIPAENIVEPKASVAGPALQGLAFSHDEPSLRELYLNLLATSMNSETSASAHPAFVEIIKQMTAEEAQLAQSVLAIDGHQSIAEIRLGKSGSYEVIHRHLCSVHSNGQPVEVESLPVTIDNWERLGLVRTNYTIKLAGDDVYAWVEKRPELLRMREKHGVDHITIQHGVMMISDLGRRFAQAVGISS